jgi:hypothetical protein
MIATAQKIVSDFRKLGVRLWADNGSIFWDAPKGIVTPDRLEILQKNKPAILDFLNQDASLMIEDEDVSRLTIEIDAMVEESRRVCPQCQTEECADCRLKSGLETRLKMAKAQLEKCHQFWEQRVNELEGQGIVHEDATKIASKEILESKEWQAGL